VTLETPYGDPALSPEGDDDLDLAPPPRRHLGALTGTLLAGLLAAGTFAGGVLAQKSHDRGLLAGATVGRAGRTAAFAGGGFAGGGFAGGGFAGGGFAGGAGGGGAGGGGAGSGTAAAGPVVIGTVVSSTGTSLVVKNFAGRTVTVSLGEGTAVTRSTAVAPAALRPGTAVSITGTTAPDGSVTATAVTSR